MSFLTFLLYFVASKVIVELLFFSGLYLYHRFRTKTEMEKLADAIRSGQIQVKTLSVDDLYPKNNSDDDGGPTWQ